MCPCMPVYNLPTVIRSMTHAPAYTTKAQCNARLDNLIIVDLSTILFKICVHEIGKVSRVVEAQVKSLSSPSWVIEFEVLSMLLIALSNDGFASE